MIPKTTTNNNFNEKEKKRIYYSLTKNRPRILQCKKFKVDLLKISEKKLDGTK